MSATQQFASLSAGPGGTSPAENGTGETTVQLDTGSISGNLLVLAASLAESQQRSTGQLSTIGGHLHEMTDHLRSLAQGSNDLNAAFGIRPGDSAAPVTFALHDQTIEKMVERLSDRFQLRFAEHSAATAALHQRVEHLAERVEHLSSHPVGEDVVGGVVTAVTRDQMSGLHAVVEELRHQVRELLAGGGPGARGSDETHPTSPSSTARRRTP
jgi:hypothetical protein